MQSCIRDLLIASIALLCVSCATPMKQSEVEKIKTVGVINQFPEYPNFVSVGTTIFNNDYDKIEDHQFHAYVSQVVLDYLKSKGLGAREITDSAEAKNNVDLVLYLIPRDVYQVPETFGFGVNQRSFLGVLGPANTYVALNISPYLHGERMGSAFYRENLSKLQIEQLPGKYSSLTVDQKKHVEGDLKKNIQESITELLKKVGL